MPLDPSPPPDDPALGRPWGVPAAVALGAALVALALYLPTFLAGPQAVPGDPLADVWMRLWGYWWVRESLENTGHYPLSTPLLNYPLGGALFVLDPVHCLLAWPLERLLGLARAYDAIVVLMTSLGVLGAWWLGWEVTRSRSAALVAGAVYGFSPWFLTYAVGSGQSEVQNVGWIALFAAALLWTMRRRELRYPVLLGVSCWLATLGSFYFGLFCALVALVIVGGSLVAGERRDGAGWTLLPGAGTGLPAPDAGSAARVLGAALLAAFLLVPMGTAFLATLKAPDSLYVQEFGIDRSETIWREFWTTHYYMEVSAPLDFVAPGKARVRTSTVVDRLSHTSYLGLLALGLALGGCVRRGPGRFWTLGALFFALLATGPYWGSWDRWTMPRPSPGESPWCVVNPLYLALFRALPFFDLVGIPHRLVVPAQLFLAVAAAWGAKVLVVDRLRGRRRALAGLGMALAVLAEVLLVSPTPWPLPATNAVVPEVYGAFAADREPYGLLELPLHRREFSLVPAERFFYQVEHRKGLPLMMSGTFSPYLEKNAFARHLFDLEEAWFRAGGRDPLPPPPPEAEVSEAVERLGRDGYRYVVLQPSEYPAPVLEAVRPLLDRHLERVGSLERGGYEVYRFPSWAPASTTPAGETGARPSRTPSSRR